VFARRLRRRLLPWQREALAVGCERIDGPGSPFAYDMVIWVVGRRCGKTVGAFGPQLQRALAGPIRLPTGRMVPFRGAHTAQNLVAAQRRFIDDVATPFRETLRPGERKAVKLLRNIAQTQLLVDTRTRRNPDASWASRVSIFAPTAGGIRGDGSAVITVDEALALTVAEAERLQTAARPTLGDYHGHGQQWIISNVGGDPRTHNGWLTGLIAQGRAAVQAGRRTGIAYLEFSIGDDDDPADEACWWRVHPGLAYGLIGIDTMRRDAEELGVDAFAAEYLGRLPRPPAGEVDTDPFDVAAWQACQADPGVSVLGEHPQPGTLMLGIDTDPDRRVAVACLAALQPDGRVALEVAHAFPRPQAPDLRDWVLAVHTAHQLHTVGVDPITCGRLAAELSAAGIPVREFTRAQAAQAYTDLRDLISGQRLLHSGDQLLTAHLAAATVRDYGDGGRVLSRRHSDQPIPGAVAAALAVSLAADPDPPWFAY
jgi:hypothetical protein